MSCICNFSFDAEPIIIKGENTASFYRNFLTIDLENPDNIQISKAEFATGNIVKPYINPIFPININFNEDETADLENKNRGFLVLYDNQGRRYICPGYCEFYAKNGAFCYA